MAITTEGKGEFLPLQSFLNLIKIPDRQFNWIDECQFDLAAGLKFVKYRNLSVLCPALKMALYFKHKHSAIRRTVQ
jgi:hypothetical protein